MAERDPELIRVKVAAEMLGVSIRVIYDLIRSGRLPAYNLGTEDSPSFRLDVDEVRAFLRSSRVSA